MNKLEHFDFKESLYLLSIYAFLKLILDDASLFWACSTHKSTEKCGASGNIDCIQTSQLDKPRERP